MDARQRKFLRANYRAFSAAQPAFRKLRQRLLSIGGEELACCEEIMIELLLRVGHVFDRPARMVRGEPCACHRNVAELFLSGKLAALCTGWALSNDGIWRKHSWGLDQKGHIIETTARREKYFGVYLLGQTAAEFAKAILEPPGGTI